MIAAVSGLDLFKSVFPGVYNTYLEYAKITVLYIGSAGVLIQVIKSMRA